MFWTLESNGPDPITLCESCALVATNDGAGPGELFDSMQEASVVMETLAEIVGLPPMDLTSSDLGCCEQCGQERQEVTA